MELFTFLIYVASFALVLIAIAAFLKLKAGGTGLQKVFLFLNMTVVLVIVLEHLARLNCYHTVQLAAKRDSENMTGSESGLRNSQTSTNRPYRIGDVYRFGHDPFSRFGGYAKPGIINSDMIMAAPFHVKYFEDSLASSYSKCIGLYDVKNRECMRSAMEKHCSLEREVKTLDPKKQDALHEFLGDSKRATPGTAVFHLRLGDVLVDKLAQIITGSGSLEDHFDRIRDIAERGFKRILFVGGLHKSTGEKESLEMIRALQDRASAHGLDSAVVSSDPDTDLCVLSNAEFLISQRKSGYSKIAEDMALNGKREVMGVDGSRATNSNGNVAETSAMCLLAAVLYIFAFAAFAVAMFKGAPLKPGAAETPRALRLYSFAAFALATAAVVYPLVKPRPDRLYSEVWIGATYSRRMEDTWFEYILAMSMLFFTGAGLWCLCHTGSTPWGVCLPLLVAASLIFLANTSAISKEHSYATISMVVSFLLLMYLQGSKGYWVAPLMGAIIVAVWFYAHAEIDGETTEETRVSAPTWCLYYAGQIVAGMLFFVWIGLNTNLA